MKKVIASLILAVSVFAATAAVASADSGPEWSPPPADSGSSTGTGTVTVNDSGPEW
ncbi:hypothetical protein [Brevibacillus nitrificans]|uniref:hypothetical protein n=1 Tax=Brevibacillus nitrificans TaxID=651560 RepID=UPI002858E1AE|nr:hypothetical protein [Brevibacillus nitrificans]MDR7318879.1 hypothetical protein [Brevibacillus nitrificans]